MQIVGWVRVGDRAACGATVAEGLSTSLAFGRPLTFRGARMQCRKQDCVIAGHHATSTLANGREKVLHGHLTSGGCPLLSTLNDVAGVGVEKGMSAPVVVLQPGGGNWVPSAAGQPVYDEQAHLRGESGVPLAGLPYFIETSNGRTLSGRADRNGLLPRIDTLEAEEYSVFWGDEALFRTNGEGA
jgi:uncharacterized Zn-binding protein involved in type VI secretion